MTHKLCLRGGLCDLTKQIYAEKLYLNLLEDLTNFKLICHLKSELVEKNNLILC